MKQRILRGLIYTLFSIFALLIGVYLTFPTDVLADVIKAQGEAALGHRYTIDIEDVSLAGLTGVTIEGMRISPVREPGPAPTPEGSEAGEAAEGGGTSGPPAAPALDTYIDEASVVVNLLSLLGGDPEVTFEAEIGEGEVYLAWRRDAENPGGHRLTTQVRDVPLLSLGILINTLKAPLTGSIGSIDAVLRFSPEGRIAGDRMDIRLDELTRSAGWQSLGTSGLTLLTPVRLGRVWLSTELEEDHVNVTASNIENPYSEGPRSTDPPIEERDIDLSLEGRITPRFEEPGESLARLTLQLALDSTFVDANDLGQPLRQIPPMNRACDNNVCAFLLTGPLNRLQLQPWRRAR
jgi:type II secretion system protein N